MLAEPALAPGQQPRDLGHHAAHQVGVPAPGDGPDVRQRREAAERAAAEVDDVERQLGRGVGERGGGDEGAQCRRLSRLRPARDDDVPRRAGQVGPEQVATLLVGPVDQPERETQRPVGGEPGRGQATVGGALQRREQRLERGRALQGRQPHLVGGRARLAQPLDDRVEHARHGGPVVVATGHDAVPRHRLPAPSGPGQCGRQVDPPAVERARRACGPAGIETGRALGARQGLAAPVRAGDVAGGEPHHRRGVRAQVADPGDRRQRRGVRHPEHGAGVRGGERPQADPVRQVRVQPAQPPLVEALRGEQQVDLQRAPEAADRGEEVGEVRLLVQQLGELVDDDEQRGQRLEVGAALPGALVVRDAREVPRRAQQFLAAVHLPGQRVLHAVDEAEVVGEVGDDGGDVGRRASPANVAPPLKSTRTRLSAADECVVTSPRTSVRSSSDLPEPVAPTHRPWGPIPSCAASLRSSSTGSPSSPIPNGTRSRSRTARGRQAAATSKVSGSPGTPSSSSRPGVDGPASSRAAPGVRHGASRRARASASGPESPSGRPNHSIPPPLPAPTRSPPSGSSPTTRRSPRRATRPSRAPSRSTRVTPARPSSTSARSPSSPSGPRPPRRGPPRRGRRRRAPRPPGPRRRG